MLHQILKRRGSCFTAAGPTGLCVQHLMDAAETPFQTAIMSSLKAVVHLLASGKAPSQQSVFPAGGNLTALNKSKPDCPLDVRPIAVVETLRCLMGKCLCAAVKCKAAEFFQPHQFGVACPFGTEKIAHGLRGCIEEHWSDPEFAVLKVDLKNAFNMVSRQALLVEVKNHFPELLPWACWCYELHPILWHTMGHLQSESGVQQGDPLGPLFFDLVLNLLISEIFEDEVYSSNLQFHALYHDDGVLAGPISAVHRALALIKVIGPPLGLFVNMSKCEVFSRSDLSLFPIDMQQSHNPNIEILGIPIGVKDFCSAFISRKWSEARPLLERLEEVGTVDPQVALTLLCMCGGFCRLAHLARASPPSLAMTSLQLFDEDVGRCFSLCTALGTTDVAWPQAQLSLSRGGLGMRSLSCSIHCIFMLFWLWLPFQPPSL